MIPMAQAAFKTEYDKLFIGGKWVAPSTERVIEVYSPATGEYVGKVPWASAADVDAACTSARSAFDHGPWPRMTPEERQGVLANAVKLINDRADEFKFLLKAETGQPQLIVDMMQYGAALSGLQYYSGAAEKFTWKDIRDGIYGQTLVLREPVGVVGAVVAWNVPLFLACNKLGPALIAGCTMVLKPAAETPLTINALAEIEKYSDRIVIVLNKAKPGDYDRARTVLAEFDYAYPIFEVKQSTAFSRAIEQKKSLQQMVDESPLFSFHYSKPLEQVRSLIKAIANPAG